MAVDGTLTFSGPTPLVVTSPVAAGVELIDWGVAGRSWRRRTVEGAYQHGSALVTATLADAQITVRVRCKGGSWADACVHRDLLFAAVAQRSYTLTCDVEGVVDVWACQPADIVPIAGNVIGPEWVELAEQEYVLTIPAYPVEVSS